MNIQEPKYKIGQEVYYASPWKDDPAILRGIIYSITAEPRFCGNSKPFHELSYGLYNTSLNDINHIIHPIGGGDTFLEECIYPTFDACKRAMIYREMRLIEEESNKVCDKIRVIENLKEV